MTTEVIRSIKLVIPLKEIFTSNTQLLPKCKKGCKGAYLYLNPSARRYKKHVKMMIQKLITDEQAELLISKRIELVIAEFFTDVPGDTTGFIKTFEDAVSETIGVDDGVWDGFIAWRRSMKQLGLSVKDQEYKHVVILTFVFEPYGIAAFSNLLREVS